MSRAKELIRVQRETLNRSSELLRQAMRQAQSWQMLFAEAEAKAKEAMAQRDEYQRQWRHAAGRTFRDPKEVLKEYTKAAQEDYGDLIMRGVVTDNPMKKKRRKRV